MSTTGKRDAGLALISRINRWMLAGAVAATGAISVAVLGSAHGHTASSASSALTQPSQSPSSSSSSSSTSSPVVSGGS